MKAITNFNAVKQSVFTLLFFFIILFFSGVVSAQSMTAVLMETNLAERGLLPASSENVAWLGIPQPDDTSRAQYVTDITVHSGNVDNVNTNSISRTLATGDRGIVDWVIVELRVVATDAAAPANPANARIQRQFALLRADGSVVNADLEDLTAEDAVLSFEGFEFDDTNEDLYIVVNQRNHLGVMSRKKAGTDQTDTTLYTYNFADESSESLGTINAVILRRGVWALRAGDYNNDGSVGGADRTSVNNDQGLRGYQLSDFTFDASVGGADRSIVNNAQGQRLAGGLRLR